MNRFMYILAIILLLPSALLASEVGSILGGLEQLIFAGIAILIATLIPMIVYLIRKTRLVAKILFTTGSIATFAGLIMINSSGQEIQMFAPILIILGLLNIAIPFLRKPV